MRVLVAAESFVPEINGVTNSVLRVLEHLGRRGHDAVVVAAAPGPDEVAGVPVIRVPGLTVPTYRTLTVGCAGRGRIGHLLRHYRPDVVHLAAPVVLGATVGAAARRAGVPTVAVFQTDLARFAGDYGLGVAARPVWRWIRRVHALADLTLAPSSASAFDLRRHGIGPIAQWGRGVDAELFRPDRRSENVRRSLAPRGEVLVGYVGRLASEKRVDQLAELAGLRGTRVVVVGDGPDRTRLERLLPSARFLGFRAGVALAETMASLDVFVHTGPHETFCQTVQEAMASGVPVVAPARGGPMDLVQHARTGYLFPPDQPALLRPTVETLVDDPGLRREMGSAGRAAVARRTWGSVGDQLLGHYEQAIGRTPRRRHHHLAA